MNQSALCDLTWLVDEYQSSLGMKSSGATVEALALGVHVFGNDGHDMSYRAMMASARASKVIKAMANMGSQNRHVIICSYDPPPRMPPSYISSYGDELSGIVWKVRAPKGVKGQVSVKLWAKNRLNRAHREYLEKRKEVDHE